MSPDTDRDGMIHPFRMAARRGRLDSSRAVCEGCCALVALALLVLVSACDEGGQIVGPQVAAIELTIPVNTILEGETVQASAVAYGTSGEALASSAVSLNWAVESESVASVDGQGRITGLAPGQTRVAAYARGRTAMATITVEAAPEPPQITTDSPLPNGMVGTDYDAQLSATGGEVPYVWSVASGSLPSGLSLGSSTGRITGTPSSSGTSSFEIRVAGDDGLSSTKGFSLTIDPEPEAPEITTSSPLPTGTVGASYDETLQATGGETPYTWSVASGSLPSGLSLGSSTGRITGTPSSSGTSNFEIRVTGEDGLSSTKGFSLTIDPEPEAPEITSDSWLPSAWYGTPYSYELEATGGKTPYSWSLEWGQLPDGLSLSSDGVLAGTPVSPSGTYYFEVRVTGFDGVYSTKSMSLEISGHYPPVITALSDSYLEPGEYLEVDDLSDVGSVHWQIEALELDGGFGEPPVCLRIVWEREDGSVSSLVGSEPFSNPIDRAMFGSEISGLCESDELTDVTQSDDGLWSGTYLIPLADILADWSFDEGMAVIQLEASTASGEITRAWAAVGLVP